MTVPAALSHSVYLARICGGMELEPPSMLARGDRVRVLLRLSVGRPRLSPWRLFFMEDRWASPVWVGQSRKMPFVVIGGVIAGSRD
jgi:hypothetical protein